MTINTIGLDLAKHNFHVHGVDAAGSVVRTAALRRGEMIRFFRNAKPCLVGMEACATAHYWARELMRLGHEVRLIPLLMLSRSCGTARRMMQQTLQLSARPSDCLTCGSFR